MIGKQALGKQAMGRQAILMALPELPCVCDATAESAACFFETRGLRPLELPWVARKLEEDVERSRNGRPRIRCPRCAWEPSRSDLWMCVCLRAWNTFDTRGVCPACGKAWRETQCPRCNAWSPHEEWYVDESEPSA